MLKVTFLEFILRVIPEGLTFVLAAYVFSKTIINTRKYLLSSILFALTVYLFRFLPISHLVDTALNLLLFITLTVLINRLDVIKTIKAGTITMFIEFVCEGINVFILQLIMRKSSNKIFKDPIKRTLYCYPSLLILCFIVIAYYIRLKKRKELK